MLPQRGPLMYLGYQLPSSTSARAEGFELINSFVVDDNVYLVLLGEGPLKVPGA
jgi:hypothetical protein